MRIGVAKEIKPDEHRVALTPAGARELAEKGHEVVVEQSAGEGSALPDAAYAAGWQVRWWDFLFYASFGVVVASSVRIAGVLLVFSYLIVPALAGVVLGGSVLARLLIGWSFGTLVSVVGMVASAALDLPTGATVVCAFGLTLSLFGLGFRAGWLRAPRAPLEARASARAGAGDETPGGSR